MDEKFPRTIYTVDEFVAARKALAEGYKHRLRVVGTPDFKGQVKAILGLIKTAGYYDFLRTYIRTISEVDGVSQLRETDAAIWLSTYMIGNPCEGARFIIQKAEQMKSYLSGEPYYIKGELPAIRKSIDFLRTLKESIKDEALKAKCDEMLRQWTETRVL